MRHPLATLATTAAIALAAPAAQAATLTVDPAQPCYRENTTVFPAGSGFTPNSRVDFARDGMLVPVSAPILADPAGGLSLTLPLPGLDSGQHLFHFSATDSINPLNTAAMSILVTATDVIVTPKRGVANRLLTIRARGFFRGGETLWAHVVRKGGTRARTMRIGTIRGACKRVEAKRRIFPANPARGSYAVQFDTFRRYRKRRQVKFSYPVTIMPSARPKAALSRLGSG